MPVKTPEEKAAELSASKAWPERKDPLYKKMYSLQWMSHREGFLAGVEWLKKCLEREMRRMDKEQGRQRPNPTE